MGKGITVLGIQLLLNSSKGKEHVYASAVGAFGRMQGMRIENGKLSFQWDVKEQGEAKITVISASKGLIEFIMPLLLQQYSRFCVDMGM